MNDQFQSYQPTKVQFGVDTILNSAGIVKSLGRHVLIVRGSNSYSSSGFEDVVNSTFASSNIRYSLSSPVPPDPTLEDIDQITKSQEGNDIDSVIGVGGGSVIDAAKAIATTLGNSKSIYHYIDTGDSPGNATLPILAIPTTCGTSSELSKAAILTDNRNSLKKGLRGDNIFPKYAIIDPRTTLSLPLKVVAETGYDVFAHALETYISAKSNPVTNRNSLVTIEIVLKNLENALSQPSELKYRYALMEGCLYMGYNLSNSSNCLPHRMQYPLGVKTKTSHQSGLSAMYPAWIDETFNKSKIKFDVVKDLFTKNGYSSENNLAEIVREFILRLSMPGDLKHFNVTRDELIQLSNKVEGTLNLDPGYQDITTIQNIYLNSL